MVTRMSRCRFTCLLVVVSALAVATPWCRDSCLDEMTSSADAAPHTVSNVEHPYDPDWPDVRLILAQKCNACHRPGTEQTDLTSWDAIVDSPPLDDEHLVVPGNPESSLLWQYVVWNVAEQADSDEADEPLMPPEKAEWLTAGQLETIARWIKNGGLKHRLPDTCDTWPLTELDFPSAKECSTCHPKQYSEWSRSMHAYAQHSPVFEAFNLTLQERTSGTRNIRHARPHAARNGPW
jgi:hypothetical protein